MYRAAINVCACSGRAATTGNEQGSYACRVRLLSHMHVSLGPDDEGVSSQLQVQGALVLAFADQAQLNHIEG